jgi:hypothetical protein
MADNVGYTPGSGATIAADDVGGVLYQRVKVTAGPENSATDISEAFPLPVNISSDTSMSTARLLQYLDSPRGYDKSTQRQRVTAILESGTVTTVTNVTNLLNVDGYNARMQVLGQNLTAWAACVRARIT